MAFKDVYGDCKVCKGKKLTVIVGSRKKRFCPQCGEVHFDPGNGNFQRAGKKIARHDHPLWRIYNRKVFLAIGKIYPL